MSMKKQLGIEPLEPIPLGPLPENPLVSILMPNYNYGQFIGEAIESVLQQTYQNWELIICDDGSTDSSRQVIQSYAKRDTRIHYILKENGGAASALNVAYRLANGDVICFLDSDDLFAVDKLESIVISLKQGPAIGFIVHRMKIIHSGGSRSVIPYQHPETGYISDRVYKRGGRWRFVPSSAIALRREISELIFPLDEERFRSEADAFIYTIAPILTSIGFINRVLSFYRIHGGNLTGGRRLRSQDISKNIRDLKKIISGVNDRLALWGLPQIDIDKNLYFLEQKTFLAIIDRDIQWLYKVQALIKYTKGLLVDDLYTLLQKVIRLFMIWTALLVPVNYRTSYLWLFVRPSYIKEFIAGVLFR